MAITHIGSSAAAATSIAIPAHAVGDIIIISARAASNTPAAIPTAGGTVPTWTTIQSAGANTLALTTVYAIATATNHTSGTFTNASNLVVTVLRGDRTLSVGASNSANGNNVQNIVYPALTLQKTGGSSWGVRFGTRGTGHANVATAPTGWTNRASTPATPVLAGHTRADLVANPTADTVATGTTNAAYRAHTVEIKEAPLPPSAPTGLTTTPQAGGMGLGWNATTGATGYDIERDGSVIVTNQAGTTYTDSPLAQGTLYSYRVRARNEAGPGDWSSAVTGTTPAKVTSGWEATVPLYLSEPVGIVTVPISASDSVTVSLTETQASVLESSISDTLSTGFTEAQISDLGSAVSDTFAVGVTEDHASERDFVLEEALDLSLIEDTTLGGEEEPEPKAGTDELPLGLTESASIGVSLDVTGDDSLTVGLDESVAILVSFDVADLVSLALTEANETLASLTASDSVAVGVSDSMLSMSLLIALSDALSVGVTDSLAVASVVTASDSLTVELTELAEIPKRGTLTSASTGRHGLVTSGASRHTTTSSSSSIGTLVSEVE